MQDIPGSEATALRVTKKLPVTARGAVKLARQFGRALVCVRHRVDAKAQYRYTTVELLVEKAEIRPKAEATVLVRIGLTERPLRQVIIAAGAEWDPTTRLWRMSKRLAGILRLSARIVPT